jgi:hypothetical protein
MVVSILPGSAAVPMPVARLAYQNTVEPVMSRAAGGNLSAAGARVGGGAGLNPPDPEEPEEVEVGDPDGEEGEPADLADARAGLDGRTPDPAAGELLPGAAVRVPWAAPGRATATAPAATTLATAAVVVTETTLARPCSRSATRWRSLFMREL